MKAYPLDQDPVLLFVNKILDIAFEYIQEIEEDDKLIADARYKTLIEEGRVSWG